VKCRPPGNRVPEPVEANTCSQFLLRQIDVVRPEVIVALGATAATYLLGVRQSLSSLRGRWHTCRGAKAGGDVSSGVSAARSAAEGRGVEGPADGVGL
jgi:uracil-DNA glycosylase family 4